MLRLTACQAIVNQFAAVASLSRYANAGEPLYLAAGVDSFDCFHTSITSPR